VNINLSEKLVQSDPSFTLPKLTSNDFKLKNNYYVVSNGEVFNYYPIKVVERADGPIISFEKTPPVILEGLAIVGKKVYKVTVDDLLRRIIRKSREVNLEVENGSNANQSEPATPVAEVIESPVAGNKTVQRTDERGLSREAEVEIGKAADAAWTNQIRALLVALSEEEGSEEEWEITNTSQS
jgi:hypothetical protein